ncbi:hypothetical protein [Promicromonospora sp. NPDC057488]|uniref:hypothetical protein n=1 Tax=Promicromonospora sp. NPDC057488 TaxID=3346147 RepID=UPI003670ED6F
MPIKHEGKILDIDPAAVEQTILDKGGQKLADPSARVVRLMNDYAAKWPLWTIPFSQRSDWSLSDELTSRLEAWAAVFNAHYDFMTGWPTAEMREAQRAEGVELAALLQAELGDEWRVDLHFWEDESAA